MATKPTLRKNGQKMATIRVQFHIGIEELAAAVALLVEDGARVSRASVMRKLTDGLQDSGYALVCRAENFDLDGGMATAERLFPEYL